MSVTVTQNTQTVEIVDQRETVTVAPVTQSVTISTVGTQGIPGTAPERYYGAFQDLTTQTIASTTVAYPMVLNTTDYSNGFSRGTPTSRIVAANTGTYNIQWSGQFQNTHNADEDVTIWLRVNGVDVAGSAGYISVPSSHGGEPGHIIAGWNYILPLTAGQYFEFVWRATSTLVSLQFYSAGTSPTRPSTASLIVTVVPV
jgi:hypothetical protein